MLQNLTGWHALVILAVIVLIFGAAKLPALARSVGQSMRILKDEVRENVDDTPGQPGVASVAASVPIGPSRAPAVPTTAGAGGVRPS
ncbi:sec-independent protein translocase protein TatA [Microbacterium sp. SLBN-154]|uniref:twin-arginine translocase TatA/TatE family subunit n=1 Tax=Microbacterium sp. SLBN-154 TaxID=2768458 RepID=UPI0011534189|nr:twin-arginine translocase TatA/TatE family subunit [Microbacterium sp. SLBN-154]TQK17918.1 sec-independent protein translocase protein TatA [Microbacterium sp. SLBN-154]